MGLVHAELSLRNALDSQQLRLPVASALVDAGALMSCIPAHVAQQLQDIRPCDVTTADGAIHRAPDVGLFEFSFENRLCLHRALVPGQDVLPGAMMLQDLDLVLSPPHETIIVNPESPKLPSTIVK